LPNELLSYNALEAPKPCTIYWIESSGLID
jgi:hypothetical protein